MKGKMMSDMQKYKMDGVWWVRHEEAIAAVAAARTEGYYEGRASNIRNLRDAQRDERERIRKAVEALPVAYDERQNDLPVISRDEALAVIDGEKP
jgi:hypothetical protein